VTLKALVTGGAGFIGSHLCARLLRDGHEVICVDNLLTGRERNIEALRDDARFTFLRHDVTEPLDIAAHEAAVADAAAGAVVVFCGVVRDHDGGRGVTSLDYEGHPGAEAVLREVAAEIAADPDVYAVAVSHRVGRLAIGDTAIVAAVATAHRAQAFATCARLVDEAKARLPIWKRQVFTDGTDEWVNCP
jgi:molybdopterin synthase catalytic subunit